jgi:hypothetical protein
MIYTSYICSGLWYFSVMEQKKPKHLWEVVFLYKENNNYWVGGVHAHLEIYINQIFPYGESKRDLMHNYNYDLR